MEILTGNLSEDRELVGSVRRVVFQSENTGFTVAQLFAPKYNQEVSLVGLMPALREGDDVKCTGDWHKDKQYGWQFKVSHYETTLPATEAGIIKYLTSGLLKGMGPTIARRIVKLYGEDTLKVIDQDPDRLAEVEGMGGKRLEALKKSWSELQSSKQLLFFLQEHGIAPTLVQRIYKAFGGDSLKRIQRNPYDLAIEIHGIGFKTADQIARNLGIDADAVIRIDAGITYVLHTLAQRGHTCYPIAAFVMEAERLLDVAAARIEERLGSRSMARRVVLEGLPQYPEHPEGFVWMTAHYQAEFEIAESIEGLLEGLPSFEVKEVHQEIFTASDHFKIELAQQQHSAVKASLLQKVHIITGGPGTGKSTITKVIVKAVAQYSEKIALAAPTGRAAKRLSEVTQRRALTIHSLLNYDFAAGGFMFHEGNKLNIDYLIVDEASMIDTYLLHHLLKAVPTTARVIFVGDIDQLPSVGPGSVLKDMIASGRISVTKLTEIYRQAATSRIVQAAHAINHGQLPELRNVPDSDFFFMRCEDPEAIRQTICDLVKDRLPGRYQLDPLEDIQVLAPIKKGDIGIHKLNESLQEVLNPNPEAVNKFGKSFRIGDKVMQQSNNYKKGVYNGDVGRILAVDTAENLVSVQYDTAIVEYDFAELDELMLAYAVSVHKYQGSECPCIVMPIHRLHQVLLSRHLLYTGITRGKRLVVLIGTREALHYGTINNRAGQRYTGLLQRLFEYVGPDTTPSAPPPLSERPIITLRPEDHMTPLSDTEEEA